jgi:hypothetical protein
MGYKSFISKTILAFPPQTQLFLNFGGSPGSGIVSAKGGVAAIAAVCPGGHQSLPAGHLNRPSKRRLCLSCICPLYKSTSILIGKTFFDHKGNRNSRGGRDERCVVVKYLNTNQLR